MTNNQIIRNEAARLSAEQLHEIAAKNHTAAQIAALVAQIVVTDKDGAEHPGTIEDAELYFAADELHTFNEWKRLGKQVKKGETALIHCHLWQFTTKPSKAQREAAEAEGKEAAEHPHFYPTKAHLFSCLQVEDATAAPKGRFQNAADIIAYNRKLAAERKAASVDLEKLYELYTAEYSRLYNSNDPDDEKAEREAAKVFDDKSKNDPVFHAIVDRMIQKMDDLISSDREAASFVLALDKLNNPEQPAPQTTEDKPAAIITEEHHELPELLPAPQLPAKKTSKKRTTKKSAEKAPAAEVQQLDFASIAANVLG